ncbi:hypothetical protein EIP91_006031 [Steccherinum ochraceum]|uniref:F-box domain-containing protein n=1 Tax=Steccherinum ochraceum TaxID=92696 RepID=A0A4R0RC97_9APHY|nr:hypothetical protein EIP91_006031 [Steccherinum ochraceum]
MAFLGDLPNELLEAILVSTDVCTLGRCAQVCKRLNALILKSQPLQYLIELATYNLKDGPSSNVGPAKRLRSLRQRRLARNALKEAPREVIQVPEAGTWRHFCGSHLMYTVNSTISIMQIPSESRGIAKKWWTVDLFDINPDSTRAFAMDPDQDLLVIIIERDGHWHMFFRSFCSTRVHPDAQESSIRFPEAMVNDRNPDVGNPIWIRADYVVVHYIGTVGQEERCESVRIINWRTGEFLLTVVEPNACACTFVNDRYVVFAHEDMNTEDPFMLSVVDLSQLPHGFPENALLPKRIPALQAVCRLRLPKKKKIGFWTCIASQIDAEFRTPHSPHPSMLYSTTDEHLILFTIFFGVPTDEGAKLLVPSSTIENCVRQVEDGHVYLFTWEEWGPHGCYLTRSGGSDYNCYVNGTTALLLFRKANAPGNKRFVDCDLLEFARLGARRQLAGHIPKSELGTTKVVKKCAYGRSSVFDSHSIETYLPVRVTKMKVPTIRSPRDMNGVFLGDDCVTVSYRGAVQQVTDTFQIMSF